MAAVIRLNARGQEQFEAGAYADAAKSWSEILQILPENEANRDERDVQAIIVIDASIRAYEIACESASAAERSEHVEVLRRAVRVQQRYEAEFAAAYGASASISPELSRERDRLLELVAQAEREGEVLGPPPPPPPPYPRRDGKGLVVGGSIALASGVGMAILTGTLAPRLEGQAQTATLATGIVVSGGLLAGGATMLALGIRRRRFIVIPTYGATSVGLTLTGRF